MPYSTLILFFARAARTLRIAASRFSLPDSNLLACGLFTKPWSCASLILDRYTFRCVARSPLSLTEHVAISGLKLAVSSSEDAETFRILSFELSASCAIS